jgi:hypothetical protein
VAIRKRNLKEAIASIKGLQIYPNCRLISIRDYLFQAGMLEDSLVSKAIDIKPDYAGLLQY